MQLPLFEEQANARTRRGTAKPKPLMPAPPQPRVILSRAVEALGGIDMDVYSVFPESPAKERILPEYNGLTQAWRGRVWMGNVPGRALEKWIDKLYDEYENGGVLSAVALLPARFNAHWWNKIAAYPFCALTTRIEMTKPDGSTTKMTTPSVVAYLGPQPSRFATAFANLGVIYIPYN